MQALLDAQKQGVLKSGEIVLVVSDNPGAYALERARCCDIEAVVLDKTAYSARADFERDLRTLFSEKGIELIVLAGFMRILSREFTAAYEKRIINVHPSLIPAFCGEGYYGLRVHQAALHYGVKLTGATVHFVNEIPDGGEIILQKAVPVRRGDTPEILQKRVMEQAEWKLLPRACELVSRKLQKERDSR